MFHRQLELDNIVNKLPSAHLQLHLPSGSFPRDVQAQISYVSLIIRLAFSCRFHIRLWLHFVIISTGWVKSWICEHCYVHTYISTYVYYIHKYIQVYLPNYLPT
jgi:hypothetical protein